jgi:two-component system cell cycle sensor histidine kinase/response regulator CckA
LRHGVPKSTPNRPGTSPGSNGDHSPSTLEVCWRKPVYSTVRTIARLAAAVLYFAESEAILHIPELFGRIPVYVAYWETCKMKDQDKTKEQLVNELGELRQRIAELEAAEAKREQAEEALRESEENLRQAQRIAHLGSWALDLESNTFVVSEEMLSIYKYEGRYTGAVSVEEFAQYIHPDDKARVAAALDNAIAGVAPYDLEFRILRTDGQVRTLSAQGEVIKDEEGRPIRMVGTGLDITERKQAEEALRESEERFRQMAENTRDIFWMRDLKSRELIYITPAYERLWGRLVEDTYPKPTSWMMDVHPEDRERVATAVIKQTQGEPTENEYRIVWPDGSIHWIRDRVFPILDEAGEAYRMVGVVEDITERKRAEEKLQESERKFRTFTESAPVAILIYRNYECVYANPEAEQITGYTNEELSSMEFWELTHPDYRNIVIEGGKALERGELRVSESQLKIVAKNGEERWIDGRLQVIEYEGKRAVLISALDITDRMQAEQERGRLLAQIREQAQRMQQILDTVPEGVLLLDPDEQIILVNPVAERELVALSDARTGDTLTHLGDRPLAELLTSPPRGLWHEVTAGDRSFQAIARPIEDGATPAGWVLVIRDVTQQREIEKRIQQQERLAAVGQLAAGIAHDFNNIMATVVLYAQMTARMEELPATVRDRMETINQQAGHATQLIQQILDFSRRAVLERRPLDLGLLLKEHVKLLERTLPESIEIRLDCEPGEYAAPFTVNADPTRMQQMVTNLALNARDAMPGGGELHVGLKRIEVRAGESPLLPRMEPGEWVQVTVSDTGTGIPSDVLPHIFEPFFTTRAPLGSGLGLAQVHGIVGQHGGRIDVETQVGRGTTFTIYLPVHPLELSAGAPSQELPALATGQGETVLVVEDDANVRKALMESLELLNYRVLEAMNGREALAKVEELGDEIGLVLSDVVMPEMGGIALLHALRERGLGVPVVMLTGHAVQREMEELRAQGMADWLPKPPQLEQLAEVVARILGTD